MANVAFVLLLCLQASTSSNALMKYDSLDVSKAGPKVHMYVLNLDERGDKCRCMQAQLAHSPYPITRFSAVNPGNLHEVCPHMRNPSIRPHSEPGTMSLVCSNVQVWKLAQEKDIDFAIIFEDDTVIAVDFWEKLDKFLRTGCQDFDYVMVDPWKTGGLPLVENDPLDGCPGDDGFKLTKLSIGHNGAHMQIIRHSALKTMIQRAMDNIDHESTPDKFAFGAVSHDYPLKTAAGVAGIATQAHKLEKGVLGKFTVLPECGKSVFDQEDRKHTENDKLLRFDEPPFQCK